MASGESELVAGDKAMIQKKRLLYILGDQRSGTTALEYVLSTNPQLHACGEVMLLEPFIGNEPRYKISKGRCTCGVIVNECSFWRPVLSEVSGELGVKICEIRTNLKDGVADEELKKHIRCLYEKAYAQVGGGLLDSSKELSYLLLLREVLPDWQIDIVRISRDPYQVVSSVMKWREEFGKRRVSPYVFLWQWVRKNRKSKLWGKQQKSASYTEASYEEFVTQSDQTITRILKHFGYTTNFKKKLNLRELHTIAGTPTRFDHAEFELKDKPMLNKPAKMPIGFALLARIAANRYS